MRRFATVVGWSVAGLLTLVEVALSVGISIAAHTDHQFLIVTGGSMEPTYPLGSGLLLKDLPAEEVTPGTVITYRSVEGALTTHRVLARETLGNHDYVQTQGDANAEPDPDLTPVDAVIGTPVLSIPHGGYAASFLLSGLGRFFVFCPPLLMLLLVEIRMIRAYFATSPTATAPRHRTGTPSRVGVTTRTTAATVMAAVLAGSVGAGTLIARSTAVFVNAGHTTANTVATDALLPVTGLEVSTAGGTNTLAWTATASPYATGYAVLRADGLSGGPYTQIGTVSGRATTTYADPAPNRAVTYAVRALANNWSSGDSGPASLIGPWITTGWTSCATNAADTGGDNDGYQTTPANACGSADGVFASDANSGNSTVNDCLNAGKDRHRYHDFSLAIPASGEIRGIEVQTVGQQNRTGAAGHCLQLSPDGGSTWTAMKSAYYTDRDTPTTLTYGSPTDLWGTAWTPATLDDASFRVRIVNVAATTNRQFDLDSVQVRVTYRW